MDRGAAGAKGGRETFRRYGSKYMAEIGKRGFEATVNHHWKGDRDGYRQYLANRGWEKRTASFVDRELERRLEEGAPIASMELPVVADPDDEPMPF